MLGTLTIALLTIIFKFHRTLIGAVLIDIVPLNFKILCSNTIFDPDYLTNHAAHSD